MTIFGVLLVCVCAQRPFYAGGQYPTVLQQNLPVDTVGNRFGENSTPNPYVPKEIDPVYNVDKETVDRIKNEYPRDKQPFWYVNAAQINSFKIQQQQQQQQLIIQQQQLQAQLQQVNELLRRQQELNQQLEASQQNGIGLQQQQQQRKLRRSG